MTQPNTTLPPAPGDDQVSVPDVDSALDDLLGSSEMLGFGQSTHEETDDDADNADLEDDDLEDDESGDEEDEADGEDTAEDEVDDDDDEESTEEDDDEDGEDEEEEEDDADEIDMEFKVPVKIDGEAGEVELGELIKGYQTSQHLSKKGRELADERKAFEAERDEELKKVHETAEVLVAQSQFQENELATRYTELQEEAKAAKKDGDSYRVDEIKDEMEEVQQEYWKARKTREKIADAVTKQAEKKAEEAFAAQVEKFNEEIGDYVPDFNEEKATALREFAISKGIPEEVLTTLADARIIGALNEFMELTQKVTKGSAKRKKAPVRKAAPTKKARPTSEKKKAASQKVKKRIQEGTATEEDFEASLDELVGNYFS